MIMKLVVVVLVVAAEVTCLPQEVPGLANMEILKIVPKHSSPSAHEPLPPLTPTAADRRYDVMIDYDDYFYDDYGQDEVVATTLERPRTRLTTELSDYVLLPFELNLHRQSDMRNGFVEETQATPPETPSGQAEELLGFEKQMALGDSDVSNHPFPFPAHSRVAGLVPGASGNRYETTEVTMVHSNTERFLPDAEERFVPDTVRFLSDTRDSFVPPTNEQFVSVTEEQVLPHTDESLVQDNSERFPQDPAKVQTILHHATLTPDGPLPAPDRAAHPLVTEESIQHDTVVLAPPNALLATKQGIEIRKPAISSASTLRRTPYRPNHHDSRSAEVYLRDAQHSNQVSLLSSSLQDSYASRGTRDEASSRASYSRALHHSDPPPSLRPQHSRDYYKTSGKSDPKSTTVEMKDASHQTTQQDRALSNLNPSYVRRVEAHFDTKRNGALQERPPTGPMSREERAYYTGLQQEIEKSDLLVDAIKDVRTREGKSIKTLRRRNDNHPPAITSPPPDIQEVKKKFGSHPLYRDLPRKEPQTVKVAGPLLHRDEYDSERDEYEKMYLPVRAKTLELREIRKVKEHFHSLVPLKTKKKPHSTSPPRRKPQAPPVTTYKPPVISEYIKHYKPQSVTTAKPYFAKTPGISYVKLQRKTIPAPPRSSRLLSGHPTVHGPPSSGAFPSRQYPPQPVPAISNSRNTPASSPRGNTTPSDQRSTKTHKLFYPNTHKPLSPSSKTPRSHRSSRLYRPYEQPSSAFKSQRPYNSRTQRSFNPQQRDPLPLKTAFVPPYPSGYSNTRTRVTEPGRDTRDLAVIQQPTLKAKVRRKRGPEMEEFLDAKMKFPKYGFDIDPYFSDFPRFGFFDSVAEKGS